MADHWNAAQDFLRFIFAPWPKKIWFENFSRKFFFLQRCLPVTAAEWVTPLCCLQIALSGYEPTNAWPDFDKDLILILLKFNQNFDTNWEQMKQVGHPPLLQKALSLTVNQPMHDQIWVKLNQIENKWAKSTAPLSRKYMALSVLVPTNNALPDSRFWSK